MNVAEQIRRGELDCNMHQFFFSTLIKALMVDLNSILKIRGARVPHMILNTGDDTMWLLEKDYDFSKEPCEVTNEQYVYNTVPRCIVNPQSIDMLPDKITNPYTTGKFQFEYDNELHTLMGEFRRMPIQLNVECKYVLGSFTDTLEMCQHIVTKLAFIRTFKFVYLGQTMFASYKIPEAFDEEHMMEIEGDSQESKNRQITITLEVESNIPIFAPATVSEIKVLVHPETSIKMENNAPIERDLTSRSGYRGARFGRKHQG